jgi:hypothetical protein
MPTSIEQARAAGMPPSDFQVGKGPYHGLSRADSQQNIELAKLTQREHNEGFATDQRA